MLFSLTETQDQKWSIPDGTTTICTVIVLVNINYTYIFEVFDEEVAQSQIMTDLLGWENVRFYMLIAQAELNLISKHKSYLGQLFCSREAKLNFQSISAGVINGTTTSIASTVTQLWVNLEVKPQSWFW